MASQPKPKHVVLVSPEGDDSEVTSATAFNNLVYGAGYKPKHGTVDEAYAAVVALAQDQPDAAPTQAATSPAPAEKK